VKVERGRIAEALRAQGKDDAAAAASSVLPALVDTDRHREALLDLGVDVDHLLDHLGRGGLGKMIGG
jgi:F0F1-type ATP synthase membrane subunit b/b'